MRDRILNASYYPSAHADHPELGNAFRDWVDSTFAFYSGARLRRSVAHPAPVQSVRQLLRHLATASSRQGDGIGGDAEPIRILVMGGSVTYGHRCYLNSEVAGLPWVKESDCAWPARLEKMLNQVLSPEYPGLFQVTNNAIRATNSEVGAALLEKQLIVDPAAPPHVVISAYATNDGLDPDVGASSHRHQENLVRAALRLRPCDDALPLVVLADDLHPGLNGGMDSEVDLEVTGKMYKVASWYDVMMVTYANVARPAALARYQSMSSPDPLFGSAFDNVHLGLGFHFGMAWTVLFNLLSSVVDTCADVASDRIVNNAEASNPLVAPAGANASSSKFAEPPIKYVGPISSADVAAPQWRENLRRKNEECDVLMRSNESRTVVDDGSMGMEAQSTKTTKMSLRPPYSNGVCSYGWMASPATLYTPQAIADALQPVLVRQLGWTIRDGTVWTSPCFATDMSNATFELAVRNVSAPVQHLTVFYTRSYLPTFQQSKLVLTVRVESLPPSSREQTTSSASPPLPQPRPPQGEVDVYEISGHHEFKTSVNYPIQFRLPGSGARVGDTIHVEARLVSGQEFKIAGLAFCR
jgi:hypothetical protein